MPPVQCNDATITVPQVLSLAGRRPSDNTDVGPRSRGVVFLIGRILPHRIGSPTPAD